MEKTVFKFAPEELNDILRRLARHHGIFYAFWRNIHPRLTTDAQLIDTAAVFFDKGEQADFLIYQPFWERLTPEQQEFIICHECLHVILEHGARSKWNENSNAAMDVVVNEMLVKAFGFDRNIWPEDDWCWLSTVFEPAENAEKDRAYEYYQDLLDARGQKSVFPKLINNHPSLPKHNVKQFIDELLSQLGKEQVDVLDDILKRAPDRIGGKGTMGLDLLMEELARKRKPKWETIVKNWSRKIKEKVTIEEDWTTRPRRLMSSPNDLFLPSQRTVNLRKLANDRTKVWFFLDTSGSCQGYAKRFWAVVHTLPMDKFDTKLACFDTAVYPINLEDRKLYGFGGTSFCILEEAIQADMRNTGSKYPNAVFVVTDGAGDKVTPQYPKRWNWLLTPGGDDHLISRDSQVYKLEDFE